MLHSGCEPEALELAKKMAEAFEGCDYVVVNAAGCGSSMKDYGDLLSDDEEWAERAERFSGKVRDVSQLLVESEPVLPAILSRSKWRTTTPATSPMPRRSGRSRARC